jgi:PAS domain S-box-containing protein
MGQTADAALGQDPLGFLAGGGEMGERTRAFDWAQTPVGPAAGWPQSLKTVVRIMLDSRYAMWLGWGPEFTFFYNDAYARMTLGPKHPWALGRPAKQVWPEIWADVGSRAELVLRTGQATWDEGLLLFLERRGFKEESYHTFSYSPVPDDTGRVGGMLCVVTEDTERTIGERRLRTLRELATNTTETVQSAEEACRTAARTLAENPRDLPFALIYLLNSDSATVRLAGAAGLEEGSAGVPGRIDLSQPDGLEKTWPLRAVLLNPSGPQVVDDIAGRFGPLCCGVWPESPQRAVVLPLAKAGQTRLAGFLVAGLSPRLVFNDGYKGFMDLIAGQIATAVANAQAYEEERKQVQALAELDRAKTTFFSNVSHEFRTPLTLMLGPLQDVLSEPPEAIPERVRTDLAVAHRNSLRLLKLVNSLLDFARIEAARVQPNYQPTDLAALTNDLASAFRSAMERAKLRLVLDCPPLDEPVYVDRDMWEKIILNLLSNAFKYTFAGEIEVTLRRVDNRAELAVRDTGTGIPAEELPRLFERFHRIQGARARTHEGTGIGLALVQELVKLHGGTIRVESQVERGTTFLVGIPLGTDHLPADRIAAPSTLASTAIGAAPYVEEALHWISAEQTPERNVPGEVDVAVGEDDRAPAQKKTDAGRILLADDNQDLREYVARLLGARYEVEAVADGQSALEAARRRKPDLILTDVMMPRLDGFGLLKELRKDAALRDTPVIMLSARAGEEARVEGVESGADDYLVKPFSARELLARVGALIETDRMRRKTSAALSRLNELGLHLWQTSGLAQGLDEMLGATIELLHADMGVVQLFDAKQQVLVLAAQRGFGDNFREFFREVSTKDDSASGRALRTGAHVLIEDVESDPLYRPYLSAARAAGYRAVSSAPLFDRDGAPLGMLSTHFRQPHRPSDQDLRALDLYLRQAVSFIERLRMEDAVRESEERFRAVVETTPECVKIVSPEGHLLYMNAAGLGMVEADSDRDLLGRPVVDLVVPDQRAVWLARHEQISRGKRVNWEFEIVGLKGTRRWMESHAVPLGLPDGRTAQLSVTRDVTEKKRVERERENLLEAERNARAEAQRANQLKDEFLATLSHELRTPLNAIMGWAQLMAFSTMSAAEMKEAGRAIERNARTQKQLIDDLLDMSRIISGKFRLDLEEIEPISVLEAAIETIRPSAAVKEIRLETFLDPLAGPISADPARLQQVVWNLLSNAVKFTPKGGKIQIRLEQVNSQIELSVSDTGQGIDPNFLPHLFQRFRQADASTTRRFGGLGIGLAIVKEIVELHGGTVSATSGGEGKGAAFTVTLPLSALHKSARPGRSIRTRPGGAPVEVALIDLSGLKILFVDDEPDARGLVKRLLEECGAEVTTAASAMQALELLVASDHHLVISDIGMPDVDGYEFLRQLRMRNERSATVPAIALTAFARSEDRTRALRAGYINHVAKPIEPSELLATIAAVSGRVSKIRS